MHEDYGKSNYLDHSQEKSTGFEVNIQMHLLTK